MTAEPFAMAYVVCHTCGYRRYVDTNGARDLAVSTAWGAPTPKPCAECERWSGTKRPDPLLIADAAIKYVAARRANEAASVDAWSVALTNVDYAWHRLLVATGDAQE